MQQYTRILVVLLLATVQANLNYLPKILKMHAKNKDLLRYDSSEFNERQQLSVAQNSQINQMIPTNDQIIPQNDQILPKIDQHSKQNSSKDNEDNLIKKKLFKLVKEAKNDVERKMSTIDQVHEGYKNKELYKIGYIVSFLNKTYEDLINVYKFVDSNQQDWDVLKILNSYEKVKNGNDFVAELLNILEKVLKDRRKLKKTRVSSSNDSPSDKISWNYYDDS